MNFIFIDLEWNSFLNKKTKKYIHEIIEVGAVKVNKNLKEIGSLDFIIKPQFSMRLNPYVKRLTKIKETDLKTGISFAEAAERLRKFAGKNSVFITWSNTDLFVLLDNYELFTGEKTIPFMKNYTDLQKYTKYHIMTTDALKNKINSSNQISLEAAAEILGVDTSEFRLHRAISDARVCARVFETVYDPKIFSPFIYNIRKTHMYDRLIFKNHLITRLDDPGIDRAHFVLMCPHDGTKTRMVSSLKREDKGFYAYYKCKKCFDIFEMRVKFKKTFDNVIVSRIIRKVERRV